MSTPAGFTPISQQPGQPWSPPPAQSMPGAWPNLAPGQPGHPAPGVRQVSWVAVLVVSILIGSLGVDRFMMGHVGLGILKLVTLGGCGIWWLIDVILIATKYQWPGIQWV